ncbi:MAG: hypothetical protein H7066_17280, partial [Cytophagaceae bacterium]|nr:hypothetical protein [Gemmatimonadaceae bacterium]
AQESLGRLLADYLRDRVQDEDEYEPSPFILVPVPLSKRRLKDRGYNQTLWTVNDSVVRRGVMQGGPAQRSAR